MEQFSWFDIITLGLIIILAIKGVINGFIKEVFGLVGIVGGIFLASRNAQIVGNYIDANLFSFGNKSSLFLIGFLVTLIVFWLFCLFLGFAFSKMMSLSGLGAVNSIAGFIVGGAKIFLIFSVIFVAISNVQFVQEKLSKFLNGSFMYPIFVKTGTYIINIKPGEIISSDKNSTISEAIAKKIEITTNDEVKNKEKSVSDKNQTTN